MIRTKPSRLRLFARERSEQGRRKMVGGTPPSHPGPIETMDRLKKRRDFLAAARGKKAVRPGLVLQARARKTNSAPVRVGFTVTRKVGTAVTRNRARRRLRAVADRIIPVCGQAGYDYVLIGRAGTLKRSYPDLMNDLKMALRRVHTTAPAGAHNS